MEATATTVASRGNDDHSRGVGQWADGEDRVGVGEAVRLAPASGGGAVGHPAAAGPARRVVQQGHPREVHALYEHAGGAGDGEYI